MRRRLAPVLAVLVVLATLAAVPVAGHGNHLTTDAQVVDDHVVVERSFMLRQSGYAVVHIDQGGSMGRAIGHTAISGGGVENYEIPVDQAFLSQIDGAARVWIVLHRSDGDGEFEPNQDTAIVGTGGRVAGVTIPIRVSDDGNVNVVAREFGDQRIDEPRVTVRRVESNASGFVVVKANGTVLGSTPVDAGMNRNVSVPIAESFYESLALNESATLTAAVYRDDGDESFEPDADRAVTVSGEAVSSSFGVVKVKNASRSTSIVVTATATNARTTTPGDTSSGTTTVDAATDPSGSGPVSGFGLASVALATLALLASVAVLRRR